jgi:16S rRNA (guanine527-N7)-methyltransferase
LLIAWNAAINLTAIREPAAIGVRHVVDSLTAIGALRDRQVPAFVDLGSGGGFPGIPLAAALPARRALLVESIGKKATFLSTVAGAVGLAASVEVHAGRVEGLAADPAHRERWPAVTARAVGGLADLVELAFPLIRPNGCLVAWKQGNIEPELDAAERAVAATGGGEIEMREVRLTGLEGHWLAVVVKRAGTPGGYPRTAAARRGRRW